MSPLTSHHFTGLRLPAERANDNLLKTRRALWPCAGGAGLEQVVVSLP